MDKTCDLSFMDKSSDNILNLSVESPGRSPTHKQTPQEQKKDKDTASTNDAIEKYTLSQICYVNTHTNHIIHIYIYIYIYIYI